LLFNAAWNWNFGNISGADMRRGQINRLLISGVVPVRKARRAEAGNNLLYTAIKKKNTLLSASWHPIVKPFIPTDPKGKASNDLVKAFQSNTGWLQMRGQLRESIKQ